MYLSLPLYNTTHYGLWDHIVLCIDPLWNTPLIPRGGEFRANEKHALAVFYREKVCTTAGTFRISSFIDASNGCIGHDQLIPVWAKQEPHGSLIPTKTLVKGGVTAWSLARMPIPLPITRVLIIILQTGHSVPRSEGLQRRSRWPLSLSISHRDFKSHQLVRLER